MRAQSVQLRVSLTGRYATALYKEALASKNIDVILQDIKAFKELLVSADNLEQALKSKLFRIKNVISTIEEIGKLMDFSLLFVNFLKILISNRRGALIGNIFTDFLALIDTQTNTISARIEVVKINKKHLTSIEELLKEMHPNQPHRFEHYQNPELLGGFRAFIYERCLDYSLKGRLNRLSYQLKEA